MSVPASKLWFCTSVVVISFKCLFVLFFFCCCLGFWSSLRETSKKKVPSTMRFLSMFSLFPQCFELKFSHSQKYIELSALSTFRRHGADSEQDEACQAEKIKKVRFIMILKPKTFACTYAPLFFNSVQFVFLRCAPCGQPLKECSQPSRMTKLLWKVF